MSVSRHRVLMCPPQFYSIRYEINPWMSVKNQANKALAIQQWKFLRRTFAKYKIEVEEIKPGPRLPDMVFTANGGVVNGKTFIPSNFRFPQRQGERALFINYFKRRKYHVIELEPSLCFEGEGDLLPFRDVMVGGYGFRSDIRAHEAVAGILGKRLVAVELINPHFYHFDTCFAPLDDRTALYYPDAFTPSGQKRIQDLIPNAIAVTPAEGFGMCCNAFRVGKIVFMHRAVPRLSRLLEQAGFKVVEAATSEFIKAGGSVKCMVLRLSGGNG